MMTNWKDYIITEKNSHSSYIKFRLDGYVRYEEGSENYIDCKNTLPFCDWEESDEIKIDNEKTREHSSGETFSFYDNVAFKRSASSSRALTRVQSDYSSLQSQYYGLQSRTSSLESEKSNLQSLISAGQRELSTKNNQITTYSSQLTTAQNQFRDSQNQLVATQNQLAVRNNAFDVLTQQFNALQIASNNKDQELEKRENKIKELKEMLGKSQEEILNHKLGVKEGRLETLIQQLGVNRDRILVLRNTYQDLIRARENYNQGNINNANNNIEQIKGGLLNGGVSVENMQKICRKTEKLAKLRIEQEKLYQEQHEARQQQQALILHNNN